MLSRVLRLGRGLATQAPAQVRNIVAVKRKRRQRATNEPKGAAEESPLLSWVRDDTLRRLEIKEAEYKKKLLEIKSLTRRVATMVGEGEKRKLKEIRDKEDAEAMANALLEQGSNETSAQVDQVYQQLNAPESAELDKGSVARIESQQEFSPTALSHLMVPESLDIPQPFVDKLGLSIKYLMSTKTQNWPMIIHQIEESGGFKGVSSHDIRTFMKNIPLKDLDEIMISRLEKLLEDANIRKSSKFVEIFIAGLSQGGTVSDLNMAKIDEYVTFLKNRKRGNGRLQRSTYELIIKALGKNNNLARINEMLAEMKLVNIQPSRVTFSNILTSCVYKAKDHKQAVEIFDSMKFISASTKPTTRNYQDIIVSHVNNDGIEKALDLYQEMLQYKVELNQKILVALARGCTHRSELKLKSWEFMFEVYNRGWEPELETFEMILLLAANDGDVALSRALYHKLNATKSITPRAFTFLLLSYSKFKESLELPTITFNESGRLFRRRILSDVELDVPNSSAEPQFSVPFLPRVELSKSSEVMAESSAIWAHMLIFNKWMISEECADIFLRIANEHGTLNDFITRFEKFTYLDESGIPQLREITIEEPEQVALDEAEEGEGTTEDSFGVEKAEDVLGDLTQSLIINALVNNSVKIPRNTKVYLTALQAAGKFQSYNFGQQVWNERGLFRKSNRFTTLNRSTKDKEDFQFAAGMVSALTKMGMLSDALAIVVSSEYQFRWSRTELSQLFHTASEVGDKYIVDTVTAITSRSLIKWEGKIKRKDYKKYVMQRGY